MSLVPGYKWGIVPKWRILLFLFPSFFWMMMYSQVSMPISISFILRVTCLLISKHSIHVLAISWFVTKLDSLVIRLCKSIFFIFCSHHPKLANNLGKRRKKTSQSAFILDFHFNNVRFTLRVEREFLPSSEYFLFELYILHNDAKHYYS